MTRAKGGEVARARRRGGGPGRATSEADATAVAQAADADANGEASLEELGAEAGGGRALEVAAEAVDVLPPPAEDDEGAAGRIARPRDPVRAFIDEARRHPRLSEDEERRLARAVRERSDPAAARRLVIHNLRLVVALAYQYRQAWTNILDLFQEGSVGLLEAVKRWDPELGTRFGTYAAYWIRAYVLRFLMTNARLIHVGNTRAGRKLFFRLERERQKLLAAGFDATPKLLAAKLDVDESDVAEVSAHLASREVPLEPRPGADDDEASLQDRVPAAGASPEASAARAEMADAIAALTARFAAGLADERERAIWDEHLVAGDDGVPLAALGERFGVSKQRMGQIATRLKERFRALVIAELGQDMRLSWRED